VEASLRKEVVFAIRPPDEGLLASRTGERAEPKNEWSGEDHCKHSDDELRNVRRKHAGANHAYKRTRGNRIRRVRPCSSKLAPPSLVGVTDALRSSLESGMPLRICGVGHSNCYKSVRQGPNAHTYGTGPARLDGSASGFRRTPRSCPRAAGRPAAARDSDRASARPGLGGIILAGLSGLVDGEHFFDTFAEDARFESLYVVILEYAVHGKIVATNVPYDFASSDRLVTSTIAQVVKDQIDIGYGVHRCRGAHRSHIRCNESDEEQRQAGRPRGVRAD